MARRKKRSKKKPIENYGHRDKERLTNPPVGLVTPDTDKDTGQKTKYEYDPHLDPQFVWAGKAEHNWHVLSFPRFVKVAVSIIIPMHNKCLYSFACLKSVFCNTTDINYEIITVDDGSQDDTPQMLSQCENIKIITNNEAKGAVIACNQGIQLSQGKYILLLNNDTKVTAGWLDALLETFRNDPNTGLVGAKLIYAKGSLQEAGGTIWKDGKAWNYGRGDDPAKPEYCYVRQVDYCSGAAILVRKDIIEGLGGLDLRYVPACYEDTDLAFAVRELGFKTVFQPFSRVIHYEGVTYGKSAFAGIKKFQFTNRIKFQEKWQNVLAKQFNHNEKRYLARERGKKKRILIIDHYVPEYDRDSGSVRMSWIIKILDELGHKVVFWPDNLQCREPYTSRLQWMGVEVVYGKNSLSKYLASNGKYIDLVWICRRGIAWKYHKTVRKLTNAPICFDTIDLHYLRESRQADINGQRILMKSAQKSKKMELTLAANSNITLVVTPVEKNLLKKEGIFNVRILSNIHALSFSPTPLDERKDLMFIGGFAHLPNVDAIIWFVGSIWPDIKRQLPGIKFYIVGSSPPRCIRALANTDVIVTGYQKEVESYFRQSKVFVCPLRYGAGIKGKIGHSMSMGLPVVTTSIGAEGMGLECEESALVADDENSFVKNVVRLYTDDELWNKLSHNGIKHVKNFYSPETAKKKIQALVDEITSAGDKNMKQKIKKLVKRLLDRLPYIRTPKKKLEEFGKGATIAFPLGHYYSPFPSKQEILKREKQIFDIRGKDIDDGIDLNEKEQLELLEKLKNYYPAIPFKDHKEGKLRYYFKNQFYGYSDAIFLYCVIRHFQPKKTIEVGSGFSSAVMLDTNELFMKNKIQCHFIDPHPERLLTLLNEEDKKNHKIISDCVQDVDLELFKQVKENDILFIDSSHVSKTGGDVNHILFNILPNLNSGVLIHFHDVFYPFEYPKQWVLAGRAWNESYILRAFLQFNSRFKVVLFNNFLQRFHKDWFDENMPLCLKKNDDAIWLEECGSIWLRKL